MLLFSFNLGMGPSSPCRPVLVTGEGNRRASPFWIFTVYHFLKVWLAPVSDILCPGAGIAKVTELIVAVSPLLEG